MQYEDKIKENLIHKIASMHKRIDSLSKLKTEYKETKNALRESEQKFKRFFNNASIGMVIMNLGFPAPGQETLSEVNKAMVKFFGYSKKELSTKRISDLTHPDDLNLNVKRIKEVLSGKSKSYVLEKRYIRKDGKVIWGRLNFNILTNRRGEPVHGISTLEDITERKKAEEEIQKSEQRFKGIFEKSGIGIALLNMRGQIIECNPMLLKMLGINKKEIKLCDFARFNSSEVRNNEKDLTEKLFKGTIDKYQIEKRFIKKDGTVFWGNLTITMGFNADNKPGFAVYMIEDISIRKQLEHEILFHDIQLQTMLELNKMREANEQKIFDFIVEQSIKITQSRYSFMGFINKDETIMYPYSWSNNTLKESRVKKDPLEFKIKESGWWADVVRKKKVIMVNDYSVSNSSKKGYPKGHVKIKRFLFVPIIENKKVAGFIGVANKDKDYNKSDINALTSMVNDMWRLVKHRRSETALKESEERYRKLVETSPDAITVTDLNGIINEVSDQTVKLHGFKNKEELIGKNVFELIHPDDHAKALKNMEKALKEGSAKKLEYKLVKKNNTTFSGELNASVIKDEKGNPKAFLGITRDITERIQKEEDLILFKNLINQTNEPIYVSDIDGKIIYFNEKVCRTLSYSNDELTEMNIRDLMSNKFDDRFYFEKIKEIKKNGHGVFEAEGKTRYGEIYPVEVSIKYIVINNKEYFVSITRNITERKREEEKYKDYKEYLENIVIEKTKALRESEEKYRLITETSIDGIVNIDISGKIVFLNDAFAKMHGYEKAELLGKHFSEITKEKIAEINKLHEKAISGKKIKGEICVKNKTGSDIYTYYSAVPLFKGDMVVGITIIIKDITEIKKIKS